MLLSGRGDDAQRRAEIDRHSSGPKSSALERNERDRKVDGPPKCRQANFNGSFQDPVRDEWLPWRVSVSAVGGERLDVVPSAVGKEPSKKCSPFESPFDADHPGRCPRPGQERVAGIEGAVFASRLDHVKARGAFVDGRRLLS